ncbi:NIPA-like protein 3 [Perkinsus chesapeaki]|uniref:NIPA-like protein 3 n=1 Tax=Perkinsus chesapeaki TaxID=330153 RepID=A0A7J6N380_PERCH|nr:NIPA-like protein 3 [Perkinsus chesapeaki]
MSSTSRFVIGIVVNIVGAITTNLGTVLMKYHTAVKHGKGHSLIIGLILFCIGSILTFGSFAFAPQSLLSGISAIQFVSNLFFVHYFLKEPFTVYNVCGTVVIIGAIVMLVVSSNKSESINNVDTMFRDFYFSATHGYFLIGLLCVIIFVGFLFWMRTGAPILWLWKSKWPKRIQWELSLPRSQGRATRFLVPSGYTFCVAAVGAQSVVSGKVLSLIVTQAFAGHVKQLYQGRSFLVLFAWLFAAIFWVIHLNRALRIFPGAFLVPLTQVCWTLSTMLSGGIVFKEFASMQSWQLGVFFSGTGVLFFGVFLLSPRTTEDDTAQEARRRSSIAASRASSLAAMPRSETAMSVRSVADTPVSLNSITLPQYEGGPAHVPYSNEMPAAPPPPPSLEPGGLRSPGGTEITRQRTLTRIMSAMTVDAAAEVRREEGADLGGFVIEPRETRHHHHNHADTLDYRSSTEDRGESSTGTSDMPDDAELQRRRSFRLRSVSVGTNSADLDRSFPDPPYLKLSRWLAKRKRVKAEKKRLKKLQQRGARDRGFDNLASRSTTTPNSGTVDDDDQGDESSFGTLPNDVELCNMEAGNRHPRPSCLRPPGGRAAGSVGKRASFSSCTSGSRAPARPVPDTPPDSMPSCTSSAVTGRGGGGSGVDGSISEL